MRLYIHREAVLPPEMAHWRFDRAAAGLFPEFSRTSLQHWIEAGTLTADGCTRRSRDLLAAGTRLCLRAEAQTEEGDSWQPKSLPFRTVYEDEFIVVVDKAAGMVVHPAPGHRQDTLANALLHRYPELSAVPRAGIVHRIDRYTSGLLAVARSLGARDSLVRQLQKRQVRREYDAVVYGVMTGGCTVDAPIGRDTVRRTRMAVRPDGREAQTHCRVRHRFRDHTRIRATLETGRTHQVRVHMMHLGHPLVGDTLYGGRLRLPPGAGENLKDCLRAFRRQALHAATLGFAHPQDGRPCEWQSPLPADMQQLLHALNQDAQEHS